MSNNTSNTLDTLEEQLERSIENVRQIQIIVSDFQPQGNVWNRYKAEMFRAM